MTELDGLPVSGDQLKALALTNYGHFTSMLVDGQRVRGLTLHLDRLMRDCRSVFDAELGPERVRHLIRHALADINEPIVVRVTVFDPNLELGHPGAKAEPSVLVTTRPAPHTPPSALRLQSMPYCREMPEVKHVGLFGSLQHRRAAQLNGFDDALFTDAHGNISEAATSNVGFLDGDTIIWPQAPWLPGVTMALINKAHDRHTITAPVNIANLNDMEAAFTTNAVVGIRRISAIDGTRWSDEHPLVGVLRKEYTDVAAEPL